MNITQVTAIYQAVKDSAKENISQIKKLATELLRNNINQIKWLVMGGSALILTLLIAFIQWPNIKQSSAQPQVLGIESNNTATVSANPSSSDISSSKIRVDVSGAVNKPGVVSLNSGDRIDDALKLAGGYSDKADTEYLAAALNLAQKLNDGDKIYIPNKNDSFTTTANSSKEQSLYQPGNQTASALVQTSVAQSTVQSTIQAPSQLSKDSPIPTKKPTIPTPSTGPVSINTATEQELESISGIGPSYAQKIISHRPYTSLSQLCVTGVLGTGSLCQKITPLVVL